MVAKEALDAMECCGLCATPTQEEEETTEPLLRPDSRELAARADSRLSIFTFIYHFNAKNHPQYTTSSATHTLCSFPACSLLRLFFLPTARFFMYGQWNASSSGEAIVRMQSSVTYETNRAFDFATR
jgi:hypothetical protein